MPVPETYPHVRNLSTIVDKDWIEVKSVKIINNKEKAYTTMVIESDLGHFYATPYVKSQLESTSDVTGFYDVVSFTSVHGAGIALRNIPRQTRGVAPAMQFKSAMTALKEAAKAAYVAGKSAAVNSTIYEEVDEEAAGGGGTSSRGMSGAWGGATSK